MTRVVRRTPRLSPALRRALRSLQLMTGVWVSLTLLGMVLPRPAVADNCSVFTDCFGAFNSAVEAAFGLSLLAVLSLVLDFTPVVGTVKGIAEAVTGRDLLTGEELAAWERALGVVPLVGGLTALKYADDLAAAGRRVEVPPGVRRLDDAPPPGRGSGAGGAADDVGGVATPPGRWAEGDARPIDPTYQRMVDDYRAARDNPVERRRLSEAIGERGAAQYLSDATGRPLSVLRPASDAEVKPLIDLVETGQPWPHAVSFGGSRATNLVHFDGQKLIVVEAKGGSGGYGDRWSTLNPDRISQTDPQYPKDVAADMAADTTRLDGRRAIGELIEQMYDSNAVEYVGVRTGGYGDLLSGTPQVRLEHRFLGPGTAP